MQVLRSAAHTCAYPDTRTEYNERLESTKRLTARWQGGCSPGALAGSLRIELSILMAAQLSGAEAEEIGRAFGELCRAAGVTT
jgi:hypothetical protein